MDGSADSQLDRDLLDLASDAPGAWEDAGARLLQRGAAAVPLLERGLTDDRLGAVAHWRMLLILRRLGREESIPAIRAALSRGLNRGESSVILGAMEALAVFHAPEALDELMALLEHPDADVVKHAAVLVGKAGGTRAFAPLVRLLQSEDASIRYSATQGLLQLNDSAVRMKLTQHLGSETDPEVRALITSTAINS